MDTNEFKLGEILHHSEGGATFKITDIFNGNLFEASMIEDEETGELGTAYIIDGTGEVLGYRGNTWFGNFYWSMVRKPKTQYEGIVLFNDGSVYDRFYPLNDLYPDEDEYSVIREVSKPETVRVVTADQLEKLIEETK